MHELYRYMSVLYGYMSALYGYMSGQYEYAGHLFLLYTVRRGIKLRAPFPLHSIYHCSIYAKTMWQQMKEQLWVLHRHLTSKHG